MPAVILVVRVVGTAVTAVAVLIGVRRHDSAG